MTKIVDIKAFEILDSRGNPTVMAEVILDDSGLTILPNPSDENCTIYSTHPDIDTISLIDASGKIVGNYPIKISSPIYINTGAFASGIYIVNGSKQSQTITSKKIIIAH